MTDRPYPLTSKQRCKDRRTRECGCCQSVAVWWVQIQYSIFRGEDETYCLCDTHATMAKVNHTEFVECLQIWQKYRQTIITAQHEATGRSWTGQRRAIPPRYKEIGT